MSEKCLKNAECLIINYLYMENKSKIKSVACLLRLIPTRELENFAPLMSGVGIKTDENKLRESQISITPGSLEVDVNQGELNNTFEVKCKFLVDSSDEATCSHLLAMRNIPVIAIYLDANSNEKVIGSPSYPLNIKCSIASSVMNCELQGMTDTYNSVIFLQ